MPSRLANSWSDRARPVASSSNHARPREIALISAGSHLELCFCGANLGRTNLVSAPRRVKAAVAVSSTALSLAASDADDATFSPNRRPRRSLMMIVFSSTMIFSTSSRRALRLRKNALHRAQCVLRDAPRLHRVAPQHEGMLLMTLRKCLILRCLAKRGLEGRTTFFQPYGILAQPPCSSPSRERGLGSRSDRGD